MEGSINNGNIVTYEQQGQILLGVVLQNKGKKHLILNEKGSELDLAEDRLHKLPSNIPSDRSTKEAQIDFLATLRAQALEELEKLNLEDIWIFTVDEEGEFTNSTLSQLYYGDDSLLHHLVIRISLLSDTIYFKRKKDSFLPRSAEVIEELKRAKDAQIQKRQRQERTISAFVTSLKDNSTQLPDYVESDLDLLKNLAASTDTEGSGKVNEARQFLATCLDLLKLTIQGPPPEQAFKLLKKLGIFDKNTNLSLIRHGIKTDFSPDLVSAAEDLLHPESLSDYPDAAHRLDLTNLNTFTIDDATTQDMDDALSIERIQGGYQLGVHISDVASLLHFDTPLDKEACSRATSFYFPSGQIPMLPAKLSHDTCSLIVGRDRPCLSCLFELDEAFNIKEARVVPSIINVKHRYSYEEVDTLLEDGAEDLNMLYQATVSNETKRFKNGGFKVNKREVYVELLDDGIIKLIEVDENATSRAIVGESAIMANEAMANFAAANNIAVAYRGQPAPDDDQISSENLPEGAAKDYAARAQLKPSTLSFEPASHHTLGISAYIQATSPIRRYIDLCNQRQILSFIRDGKPQFSKEEFKDVIANSENARSTAMTLTKETKRFWLLRYLQQRSKQDPSIKATVLRCDRKLPLIELDEVFMPTVTRINKNTTPGDILKLKIIRVDPQFDDLKLEVVE
ncbi:MAG: ribonuclease catalytic domain-containing protein [Bdellovibrionota bacterium]